MKAIVQFGNRMTLEIEEPKELDTLHKAIALAYPRTKCEVCGATEGFYLTTNKHKAFVFVNLKCKCGARSKLGQYESGGYFWHDFEKYDPNTKEEDS